MIENWFIVIAVLCVVLIITIYLNKFLKLPTISQVAVIKQFIYMLVLEAEKELGSSTGQLKLAKVIQMFYSKCPADIRKFIPEKLIIQWIEECVIKMKSYFEKNPDIKDRLMK